MAPTEGRVTVWNKKDLQANATNATSSVVTEKYSVVDCRQT